MRSPQLLPQNPSRYPSASKRTSSGSPTTSASAFCSTSSTRFSETYRYSRCNVLGMRTKRVSSGGTPQLQIGRASCRERVKSRACGGESREKGEEGGGEKLTC